MKNLAFIAFSITIITVVLACKKNVTSTPPAPVSPGNDPNFKIQANANTAFAGFTKNVKVFGVNLYAKSDVPDAKLLHAANVMAQYLDNNADGKADNPRVVSKLVENKASLVMTAKQDQRIPPPSGFEVQDLGADETNPTYVSSGLKGRFDASLEEIFHLITQRGYANAYPTIFGENRGTALTQAMDKARGGYFATIPNPYPTGAWYTYNDATCGYGCMATEYIYWSMTSILGAQKSQARCASIQNEWKLCTKERVKTTDPAIYKLLVTDSKAKGYNFPTVLPDGKYNPKKK